MHHEFLLKHRWVVYCFQDVATKIWFDATGLKPNPATNVFWKVETQKQCLKDVDCRGGHFYRQVDISISYVVNIPYNDL